MPTGQCQRLMILAGVLSICDLSSAQRPAGTREARQLQQRIQQQAKQVAEKQPKMPADPQLLGLHKEFIAKAEKLAVEYERKRQFAEAREVYESLVRLVPNYSSAEAGLKRVLNSQSLQDRKVKEVLANQQWQDTGVTLREGMPVHLEVKGTWKVVYETGPKGIEIPHEMKPQDGRIKLGSLIAVIVGSANELADAKPFVLQDRHDFIAKKSGRLYVRMFDVDPTDNQGSLYLMIQSTFYD